jgi:hypothetical protein
MVVVLYQSTTIVVPFRGGAARALANGLGPGGCGFSTLLIALLARCGIDADATSAERRMMRA